MWIEQGPGTPIAPELQPELQQIVLEFALLEDVTGPMCSTVDRDKYVADGARRIRESIVLALQGAGIAVTATGRDWRSRARIRHRGATVFHRRTIQRREWV